ncbi:hypothetical protein ES705_40382 [subsurface metagenome]
MTERWCSWHKPVPVLLERIDDGRVEILRTHTICPDCLREMESEKAAPDLEREELLEYRVPLLREILKTIESISDN